MSPGLRRRLAFALVCAAVFSTVAAAEEPAPAVVPHGRLTGRVFERGSITPLAGARVQTAAGECESDASGRFTLELPEGAHDVLVTAEGHEPLRATEKIIAGQGLAVEYTLLPRAASRRYQSTVRGEGRHEGERFTLREQELHELPGTLGDPFRIVGSLPGVATPLPLLPYYVIRGASPGNNGFFLDGMRVPQLFHLLVGGGVVHGRLIDRLDFYPGTYDVTFGRYAGGVIDSETRAARDDGYHGDLELRLYDVSILAEAKLPKGVKVEFSGHYGYPTFIIHLVDDRIDLQYGDYQLRVDWRGFTFEALGSVDSLHIASDQFGAGALSQLPGMLRLEFHRVQVRDRERVGRAELEAAIIGGFDDNVIFDGTGVRKLSLGWRFAATVRWPRFRLQVGTDGELSRFTAEHFVDPTMPASPDQYGDLAGDRDGVVAGAYAQGTLELAGRRLLVTAGARLDTYHAGAVTLLGLDPRAQIKARLTPWLSVSGGIGLYQQPPSFPVPLPGIDTFALQLGLQHSLQGSAGVEAQLPKSVSLSVTGFYSKLWNVSDTSIDFGPVICTSPPPESLSGFPAQITRQVDGQAFGLEFLLRRSMGRFSGWIAYTLSRSERVYSCGLRPADFDQAHVLNVVGQVHLPWKLMAGARLYYASGRPVTLLSTDGVSAPVRNNSRLPDYVELDLRLDREWLFRRWAFAAFLEVQNVTFSKSVFGITYPKSNGVITSANPQVNGFNWILPSIGVRGRF
jgi:hypothetical protein